MRVLLLTTCTPDDRKVLSCVRSLGRAGFTISVASDNHLGEAYYSRYCHELIKLPHPGDHPHEYRVQLLAHLTKERYDVLLPTNDYTLLAICREETRFRDLVSIPMAHKETLLHAIDKSRVLELAQELGLRIPRTRLVERRLDLRAAIEEIGYPCVIKLNRGAGAIGLSHLYGPEDLRTISSLEHGVSDLLYDYERLLVQARLSGRIHEVAAICCQGELRVALTQTRVHMYPPSGGGGILNQTTFEPDLLELAKRLLRALRWHGPAQVEFMRDAETRIPYLMEVNGRLWGTVGLAVKAGIDVPTLCCRLAVDGDIPEYREYKVGVRYRWPLPLGLLHTLKTGRYWSGFRDFFWPAKNTSSDLWLSDPIPKLAELVFLCKRVFSRRAVRTGSRKKPWRAEEKEARTFQNNLNSEE